MSVRLTDSVLVQYTRSNDSGFFSLQHFPIDTYQVIISHPGFGDQYFIALGSEKYTAFDFGKIILPPKSVEMNEVVIYAYKDPVYFKGDTLIYTADSFKVKQNATVEDLLKKLPGIQVDGNGKITSQGKKIDKVLVDGDEFFGSDPTIATRNLGANAVESVQVYEKKNDNPNGSSDETIKVMDLILKEESRKGYFGKVSGASDFANFYEGEFLANKFKNKQKISVFAIGSNTPKASFDWGDVFKYGLENEYASGDGEGDFSFSYSNQINGLPRTLKSGFYYNDKISKKTSMNLSYTYQNNLLNSANQKSSQYFLTDTTYKTTLGHNNTQQNAGHSINFSITQQLDSATELEIVPKLSFNTASANNEALSQYLSSTDLLTRSTLVQNTTGTKNADLSGKIRLKRNFKKTDRQLVLIYNYGHSQTDQSGILQSANTYYLPFTTPNDSINQQKLRNNQLLSHSTTLSFTEPLSQKLKIEFSYDYFFNQGLQNRKANDFAGGSYSQENLTFTNSFENIKYTHRAGTRLIYEIKKLRLAGGAKLRQIQISNINRISHQQIQQTVNNILPFLTFRYKFSDNQSSTLQYNTNSTQPDLNQLQPIPDNSNPNEIKLGNPNLQPSFVQSIDGSFNHFKPVSGQYIWLGLRLAYNKNDIANKLSFDSIGRSIYEPVNISGNHNGYIYSGGQFPLFNKKFSLNPNLNSGYNNNISFINSERNTTITRYLSSALNIEVQRESFDLSLGGSYTTNYTSSTLNSQSNKPYGSHQFTYSLTYRFPKNITFSSDGEYNSNSRRSNGYNISYLLLNASISKIFFKRENFILSFLANDLLNQNISTNRTTTNNMITDNKTTIIQRYFLLKAVLKINSNKEKEENEDY